MTDYFYIHIRPHDVKEKEVMEGLMSVMKPLEWEVVDQDDGPVGRIGSSRENSPQIFLRYVKKTAIVITDFVYTVWCFS